jgi:hypothetical protein
MYHVCGDKLVVVVWRHGFHLDSLANFVVILKPTTFAPYNIFLVSKVLETWNNKLNFIKLIPGSHLYKTWVSKLSKGSSKQETWDVDMDML